LGNQLEAKLNKEFSPHWWCSTYSDWYNVWVSLQQLTPFVIDCWVNNTRLGLRDRIASLITSNKSCFRMLFQNGEYFNSEGVEIRAPGFGEISSVEYLDSYNLIPYFYYFVDFFTKQGYVRGVSLRAAPYDWRLTPGSYYSNYNMLLYFNHRSSGEGLLL